MSSQAIAALVEYGLTFLGGLFALAMGLRWVGKQPGVSKEYDLWHAKMGRHLVWLGPLLCTFALFMLIGSFRR